MNTTLNDLLGQRNFDGAASLLKETLSKAEIIDPRNDKSWAPYADFISSQIRSVKGQNDFNIFWEDLLGFFKKDLEPKWGHLHKGHIFFRLGLAKLVDNLANAKKYLEEALAEDRLLESNCEENKEIIEKRVREYSAYVMLCIIERIEEEHFSSNTEKQTFFRLIIPSFDAVIFRGEVNPTLVQNAIGKIIPSQALEQTLEVKKELDLASAQQLQTATVSLTGALLENILLSILFYQLEVKTTTKGKDIREVELGELLSVAINKKVFPSDAIRASCRTIHIFRNRLHPGNELRQQYKLTPRVAVTLKILLDLTLVEWAKDARRQSLSP